MTESIQMQWLDPKYFKINSAWTHLIPGEDCSQYSLTNCYTWSFTKDLFTTMLTRINDANLPLAHVTIETLEKNLEDNSLIMLINVTSNKIEWMMRVVYYDQYQWLRFFQKATIVKWWDLLEMDIKWISEIIYPEVDNLLLKEKKPIWIFWTIRKWAIFRLDFIHKQNKKKPGSAIAYKYEDLLRQNSWLANFICKEINEKTWDPVQYIILNQAVVDYFALNLPQE